MNISLLKKYRKIADKEYIIDDEYEYIHVIRKREGAIRVSGGIVHIHHNYSVYFCFDTLESCITALKAVKRKLVLRFVQQERVRRGRLRLLTFDLLPNGNRKVKTKV